MAGPPYSAMWDNSYHSLKLHGMLFLQTMMETLPPEAIKCKRISSICPKKYERVKTTQNWLSLLKYLPCFLLLNKKLVKSFYFQVIQRISIEYKLYILSWHIIKRT
jgi:hypothetical protein